MLTRVWLFPWEREDDPSESRALRHIAQQNDWILEQQENLVATVQQINDALAQTNTDLQTLIAAGVGGVPTAELDQVLSAVQQLDQAITAAIPAQ